MAMIVVFNGKRNIRTSMDTPIVLTFYIRPSIETKIIRSIVVKDYFSALTSNVEVLYPTQLHHGLLLCKSKRTEEKISRMKHILFNGSTVHLSPLTRHLFQPVKCSIDGSLMQISEIHKSFQQSLPFLHASGGKFQVNADSSVHLEGHINILDAIHSFILNKSIRSLTTAKNDFTDLLDLRCRTVSVRLFVGSLIDQNVESVLIPMNDKYRIHRAFDRQLQENGGIAFSNYLKELSIKGTRARQGEIILFPNRELRISAKVFVAFIVPRLTNRTETSSSLSSKESTFIDLFQPTYEQMIFQAFTTIDQNGINSLAMPILEPNAKTSSDRRIANKMSVRAMISALRHYSQNSPSKLKRFIIVDHQVQINRMSKRVKHYQKQVQTKIPLSNSIDLDNDDGHTFADIFGVPRLPRNSSESSDSDDECEPEEYILPYIDQVKN